MFLIEITYFIEEVEFIKAYKISLDFQIDISCISLHKSIIGLVMGF